MFAENFDESTDIITCLNSTGDKKSQNPNPSVDIVNVTHFYQVCCVAIKTTDRDLKAKINDDWNKEDYCGPSQNEFEAAVRLAWAGEISSLNFMKLKKIDIRKISEKMLAKLAFHITQEVKLMKIAGDVSPIILSLQCEKLYMSNVNIDRNSLSRSKFKNECNFYHLPQQNYDRKYGCICIC